MAESVKCILLEKEPEMVETATSATKLETARTIQTNLASTSNASFDGTANITPGVIGVLSVANGGTGCSNLDDLKSALGLPAWVMASAALNDNSWATISAVSLEGRASSVWSVGDTKTITINDTVGNYTFSDLSIDAFILGFDHNSSVEGSGIHFQIGKIGGVDVALCDNQYSSPIGSSGYFNMNLSDTNTGGWDASFMRKTLLGNSNTPTSPLLGSMMAALPSDLRNVMKSVTKYTDNTGGSEDSSLTATTDYLFLPSQYEVFAIQGNALVSESSYQKQYIYYANGNSKIAYKHSDASTACWWWLRSPGYDIYTTYAGSIMKDYFFCDVNTDGSSAYNEANRSAGVRPCFLV